MAVVDEPSGARWWGVIKELGMRRCESDARALTCVPVGLGLMDFVAFDVVFCDSSLRHKSHGAPFFLPEHLEWHGR